MENDNTAAAPQNVDESFSEQKPDSDVQTDAPPTTADTPAGQEDEKTWKDFGLNEFEGKSNEEIAQAIQELRRDRDYQASRYGKLSNEFGELRKQTSDKQPESKKELIDTIPDLTPGQVTDFNRIYEENPVKALIKFGGPHIEKIIEEKCLMKLYYGAIIK